MDNSKDQVEAQSSLLQHQITSLNSNTTNNSIPTTSSSLATGNATAIASRRELPLVSLIRNTSEQKLSLASKEQSSYKGIIRSQASDKTTTTTTSQQPPNFSPVRIAESHQHHSQLIGDKQTDSQLLESQSLLDRSINNNNTNNNRTPQEDDGNINNSNSLMRNMSKTTRLIPAYFLAELIGTFLIVAIGDGAISAYVLTKQKVDLFATCFSFGIGAMIGTFASAKISGAHFNPAASLAFALDGRLKWKLLPVYICAQYLGGFLAALLLMVNNLEAINALDGGQRSAYGQANSTGNIFATYPGSWVSPWGALLDQIVGTAILLFSLCAIGDKKNAGLEEKHQPIYVALIIGLVCVAFSPNCGAIFNPARDLAPRLVTAIFGYPSVWAPVDGLYWLLAGVLGPHMGAILGVFAYKFIIGFSLEAKQAIAGNEGDDDNNNNNSCGCCTSIRQCNCHVSQEKYHRKLSGGGGPIFQTHHFQQQQHNQVFPMSAGSKESSPQRNYGAAALRQ